MINIPGRNISYIILKKKVTDDIVRWVSEPTDDDQADSFYNVEARTKLGDQGMKHNAKKEALKQIGKSTKTRIKNKQKEYLLHRVINEDEAVRSNVRNGYYQNKDHKRKIGNKEFTPYTSWSHKILPLYSKGSTNHVVSAWIPESHISFYPRAYIKSKLFTLPTKNIINDEKEVIVKPGDFEILHHTELPEDSRLTPIQLWVQRDKSVGFHKDSIKHKLG